MPNRRQHGQSAPWARKCGAILLTGLAASALLVGSGVPASAAAEEPDFRIRGEEVTESSGLVISRGRPGLAYTVNDSGDTARVFVVDMSSGEVVGETSLLGVEAVDFEAMGTAPDGRLIVADIGDNRGERDSVAVHVLPEPDRGDRSVEPRSVTLTYEDGPRDAEALLARDDRLFVVSKAPFGAAVYAAPVFGEERDRFELREVAEAPPVVTDATVLADGRAVLRNYVRGFVVSLPDFALQQDFELPPLRQGESLAADVEGPWVYAGTEGENSPVYRVGVPETDGGDSGTRPSPTPRESAEAAGDESADDSDAVPRWVWWAGAALLLVGGAVVARLFRR